MFQEAPRMTAIDQQRRGENSGGGNLVRGRGVAPTRAEHNRRVISRSGQVAGEWQRGVVPRARSKVAAFEAANALARELVWPRTPLTGRFVGAMKVHHQPVLRCLAHERLIEVDDLFGLMIEEVDLHADDASFLAKAEKLPTLLRRM